MSHLPFTITAYFFNALAVTANKFLLKKVIPDPLVYVFYISLVSVLAIFALPFTKVPALDIFLIASASTIFWTIGAYFMFIALKIGQVSRVIPIIGTLIPLILLIFASSTNTLSQTQMIAIVILLIGMIFLTRSDLQGKLDKKELIFEILSAAAFAFSYIILRQAYLSLDFFSTIIWSRLVLLPLCLFMLLVPNIRKKIITSKGPAINFFSKNGLIFLGGQTTGIISEILLLFSISLANPALVNSLQGTQYIFLLIFAIIFFKEKYNFTSLISKITGIILIGSGLYLLAFS
ncbi:hypothetical protein A3I48_02150 [Candidatus Daviesbacteria bacterium RIFCSPLOWO2_02_FULL_36_7]|uniref:EamA domain-containing protein n=1 Tax=Candidatus Daviesbacteria bacterium RIFCSPLOWO2_02_FULL_36_7 TaxID=1797792 RepID=A0A1F5MI29_9BACT|nr:MAG: hypothetical protein A3I48_02150 [Candidatus Daviesbacteria bacterium RIFCSPLOWO2_02_FULL_36_7]